MTQEDKDLLLEDLCVRLPYGVKVNNEIQGDFSIYGICENYVFGRNEICHIDFNVEKIKPYLFPMSSMTKEQRKEFLEISHLENRSFYNGEKEIIIVSNEVWSFDLGGDADTEYRSVNIKRIRETIKWLNKNHFDYRGLIPLGLAIDATNLNIY